MGYTSETNHNTIQHYHPQVLLTPSSEKTTVTTCNGLRSDFSLLMPNIPIIDNPLLSKPPWMKTMRVLLMEPEIRLPAHVKLLLCIPFKQMYIFIDTILPEPVTFPVIINFIDATHDYINLESTYHGMMPPKYFKLDNSIKASRLYCYIEYLEEYNEFAMNCRNKTDNSLNNTYERTITWPAPHQNHNFKYFVTPQYQPHSYAPVVWFPQSHNAGCLYRQKCMYQNILSRRDYL